MSKCKYPHMLSPIVLGNTLFRNRIFASPTGYKNLNGDGYLNGGATAYYQRKAMGGAASAAIFERIVDGEYGRRGGADICLNTPNISKGLARIAHGDCGYGAFASLEFEHTGMFANGNPSFFGASVEGIAYDPVEYEVDGRLIENQRLRRNCNA